MTNLFSPSEYIVEPIKYDKRLISMKDILNAVAESHGIKTWHMVGRIQTSEVSNARKAFCWLARQLTANTLTEIGAVLGGRDHKTISYNIERAAEMKETSHYFARKITESRARLYV